MELYETLQSVMVTASWAPRSREIEESYALNCSSIFKAINELRVAIGEKFTSADLNVFVINCNEPYNPGVMEDAYSDGRKSSRKRAPEAIVVGTTGIGLGLGKRTVERGEKDHIVYIEVVNPAKIVLSSTLIEALETIVQPSSRQKKIPVEYTDGADR